jgi:integrase
MTIPPMSHPDLDLLTACVSDATWRKYKRDVNEFIDWVEQRGENPKRVEDIDWALVDYFQYCFQQDGSRGRRQRCVQARLGVIIKWPQVSNKLDASKAALKGWARVCPGTKRQPCPKAVCFVLIERFIQKQRKDMALILWLMFDAYFRIGEVLAVRLKDILVPSNGSPGGIRLPVTKTGRDQSVIIRNENIWKLLDAVVKELPISTSTLFLVSYPSFQKLLKEGLKELGLQRLNISAHSFRHGGASEDHLRGLPIQDIVQRGRWRIQRTAEYYIQSGRALLLGTTIPDEVRCRGEALYTNQQLLVVGI